MSDGDRPRIGPPVIHITTPEEESGKTLGDDTDAPTGRLGTHIAKKTPETSPVMRRKASGTPEANRKSRHVTLIEGCPSRGIDSLRTLPESDYASSEASDVETESQLNRTDIKRLEQALGKSCLDDVFTVDQLDQYAGQLQKDIGNFRRVISKVKKRLDERKNVGEDVKATLLEQCDKVTKYCKDLKGKLDKVEKAVGKKQTSLVLKSGAAFSYKGEDLSIPKGKESEKNLLPCADIICDGYKQLLGMSRLWKMEWPSFKFLTGFAATYAGIDIKNEAESLPMISPSDESLQELAEVFHAIITRLREQESLCTQLEALSQEHQESNTPGVKELLGTIFPDTDSRLESMPMDYYYARGGQYAQKKKPMGLFSQRLERIKGQVSALRREAEHVWKMMSEEKKTFIGPSGPTTALSEHDRIKNGQEKLETQWEEDFPSVQRIYTERVSRKKKPSR